MRAYLVLIFALLIAITGFSKGRQKSNQQAWPFYDTESGGFNPERLVYGLDMGLDFIDQQDITSQKGYNIFVSGSLGYRLGRRLILGLSSTLSYSKINIEYNNLRNEAVFEKEKIAFTSTSVSVFSRYFISRNIFLQCEPELINYNYYETSFDMDANGVSTGKYKFTNKKLQVPACLTGIGLVLPVNENVAFVLRGLYDIVQDKNSPYSNLPIIRGGFNIGAF